MRCTFAISAILALTSASPFSLSSRADGGAKVLSDMKQLAADLKAQTNILNSYPDDTTLTPIEIVQIQNASDYINHDFRTVTRATSASSVFSVRHSKAIYSYMTGTIHSDITEVLSSFVRHEPAIQKTGLKSSAKDGITTVKKLVREMMDAFIGKSKVPYAANHKALKHTLMKEFNAAIKAFS